ncbi:MAG: hypothetical protein NTY01_02170 [Verrucomicrobia bacterium]|nr:hypothetical protein [Verrucomicrobiota bacterium]
MKTLTLLLVAFTLPLLAVEQPLRDLDKIEAALKSAPDDPMLHYRKCQALFAKGREQEAVDHAAVALAKFKAVNNDLAWMSLGFIRTEKFLVDVHYNMGPKERAEKKDGIVRPYSFRVWTPEPERKLVRILDFELAYLEGQVLTAAIGEMSQGRHLNFGIVDPKSDFASVKKKVLEIIAK